MIVFLHGHHPRDIIECHGTDTEIRIIRDTADLFDESVEIGGWGAINRRNKVSRRKAILVRGRSTAL